MNNHSFLLTLGKVVNLKKDKFLLNCDEALITLLDILFLINVKLFLFYKKQYQYWIRDRISILSISFSKSSHNSACLSLSFLSWLNFVHQLNINTPPTVPITVPIEITHLLNLLTLFYEWSSSIFFAWSTLSWTYWFFCPIWSSKIYSNVSFWYWFWYMASADSNTWATRRRILSDSDIERISGCSCSLIYNLFLIYFFKLCFVFGFEKFAVFLIKIHAFSCFACWLITHGIFRLA